MLTTALLPVLFFLLLEGALRLAGYGDAYPLFTPVPEFEDYLHQNSEVARRYFAAQASIPTSLSDVFKAEKDSTTFRIFVQGGSSAAGYPYYYGGSFSRMLEQRLQQTFPDRTIEIVNTALAAVNSYTLLDFSEEILAQQPDAVLIYAGHNEYYGALGVGSAESLGRYRGFVNLYLRLRTLRTLQALRAVLAKAAATFSGRTKGAPPATTLMERMVAEQTIPYGSPLYEQGLAQFRGNLRDLLTRYQAHHIPVLIATVASNERAHRPFSSGLSPSTDPEVWKAQYREALGPAASPDDALPRLNALVARDTLSADAYFARARLLDSAARFGDARRDYLAAKDRDELRFRAPEAVNTIIREEAERAGAFVVDAHRALAQATPDGIIGSDLMLEHLHPNGEGYFLIADAFYAALRRQNRIGPWKTYVPKTEARAEMLMTAVDSLYGAYRVRQLMGSWPFQPPGVVDRSMDTVRATNPIDQLALNLYHRRINWYEATDGLRRHYEAQGNLHHALRATLAMIQQYPFLPAPYAQAADILLRQRRYDDALAYFEAANDREESARVQFMIGFLRFNRGDRTQGITHLERALVLAPDDEQTLYRLAAAYALTGDAPKARSLLERLLNRYPGHPEGARLLASLPPASN